jgi:hypothetical protein
VDARLRRNRNFKSKSLPLMNADGTDAGHQETRSAGAGDYAIGFRHYAVAGVL